MIKSYKVRIHPNNKQQQRLFATAGSARYVWNWALKYQREYYKSTGGYLNNYDLRKILTKKKSTDIKWLNNYSNNVAKQAIKDLDKAFNSFFKGKSNYPKFKSKKHMSPSFYVDPNKIKIKNGKVKLEKITLSKKKNRQCINWINLAEKDYIPEDVKYYNPRITYDGLYWWLSIGVEVSNNLEQPKNEGIGIDVGIKDLAIVSDDCYYKNINKTSKIRKLIKKEKRMQRRISKKYDTNRIKEEGGKFRYQKSINTKKLEKRKLKVTRKLKNIRHSYLHQVTNDIINRKPRFIVLEDLNIKGMMKNKHLSKALTEQELSIFRTMLEYKAQYNNIEIIYANRFYPSSKTCSHCGSIKKDLKLKDRVYKCPNCGFILDRDLNAAINLQHYGQSMTTAH